MNSFNTFNNDDTAEILSSHFPRLSLDRKLGNYFSRGYFVHRDKYHREYTHSSLAILPFFHDHGGHFEKCVMDTAAAHNEAVSPKMTFWNRLKWDTSSEGVFRFKHKFKLHYGEASFGVCDIYGMKTTDNSDTTNGHSDYMDTNSSGNLAKASTTGSIWTKCGHAVIMQDPITMALADFGDCFLNSAGRPLCQVLHDGRINVEEWIALRGNVVFRNILFSSDICQNKSVNGRIHAASNVSETGHESIQKLCESSHKKFIDSLEPDAVKSLLTFITENIHNFFSVVGTFEDLESSLILLHHVFRFPLHKCGFLSTAGRRTSEWNPKHVNHTRNALHQGGASDMSKKNFLENIANKNVALLSKLDADSQDGMPFLQTLKDIENSLLQGKASRQAVTLAPHVKENHISGGLLHTTTKEMSDTYKILKDGDDNYQKYTDLEADEISNENMSSSNPPENQYITSNNTEHFIELPENSGSNQDNLNMENINTVIVDAVEQQNLLDLVSEYISSLNAQQGKVNPPKSRLYRRLVASDKVKKSLALDLQIYDAIKKLHRAQKQLFFNSMKST